MTKVALCLFGLFRSFEKTYPLMLKNFDSENVDIDVFITTSNYNDKKYRFRRIKDMYLEKKY